MSFLTNLSNSSQETLRLNKANFSKYSLTVSQKQLAFYLIHFEIKNIFKDGNLQKFKEFLK
jgi:hypothetical protein